MDVYKLTCPACGADVEAKTNKNYCFCTYCGTKVYFDDGTHRVEVTKNITYHTVHTDEAKIKEIEVNERLSQLKYETEIKRLKQKNKKRRIDVLKSFVASLASIACIVALLIIVGDYISSEKKASNQQESELQKIVNEVLVCVENHDFETARIKAQAINYTENWSSEIEEKWDSTRKELLKQIDKAEKKWQKENKNTSTWWNPFD